MFIEKNLKHYRKKAGLKQRDLSEKTGLSYSSITKIESKSKDGMQSASPSTIAALAAVLNVRINDIYETRSFLRGNPYDFLDEPTVSHLKEEGFSRDNWNAGNTDDFSVHHINTELLMDLINQEFEITDEGVRVPHPNAGEVWYSNAGPEDSYPDDVEIPKEAFEKIINDVREYALNELNKEIGEITRYEQNDHHF